MMKDRDDELKEFFRNSPVQDEFSFDPEGWKKMHATLSAERKAMRLKFFIYLNVLLMVMGITAAFILLENKTPAKKVLASKTNLNDGTQLEVGAKGKQTEASSVNKATKNNSSPSLAAKLSSPKANETKPDRINESVNLATIPYINQLSAGKLEITLKRIFSPMAEMKEYEGKKIQVEEKTSSIAQEALLANKLERMPEQTSQNELASPHSQSLKKDSVDLVLTKNQSEAVDSTTRNGSEKATDLKSTSLLVPEKKDSLLTSIPLNKDSNATKPNTKKILSVELGSNYLLGWKSPGKTDARGFNPLIGLNYYNGITEKFGFSVGVQYTTINNLKETSHTSTTTKLKFGEEVQVTTISARKMHYLLVPLKIAYALNEKNVFCVGYTLAYLLDVKSDVNTHTERFNQKLDEEQKSEMGYRTGFIDFDGQIAFCYRRFIYKGFFMNAGFFYGIKDVKNNSVYKTEQFERNSGFKLSLSYNLFTK